MAGGEDGVLQTSGSAAELGHLGGREVEGRRRLVEEEDVEAPCNREAVRVVEVHDAPERALSDGANALRLDRLAPFWERLQALDALIKKWSIQR